MNRPLFLILTFIAFWLFVTGCAMLKALLQMDETPEQSTEDPFTGSISRLFSTTDDRSEGFRRQQKVTLRVFCVCIEAVSKPMLRVEDQANSAT